MKMAMEVTPAATAGGGGSGSVGAYSDVAFTNIALSAQPSGADDTPLVQDNNSDVRGANVSNANHPHPASSITTTTGSGGGLSLNAGLQLNVTQPLSDEGDGEHEYFAGDDGVRYTVDQAIDGAGFGRFQVRPLLFTGLDLNPNPQTLDLHSLNPKSRDPKPYSSKPCTLSPKPWTMNPKS